MLSYFAKTLEKSDNLGNSMTGKMFNLTNLLLLRRFILVC